MNYTAFGKIALFSFIAIANVAHADQSSPYVWTGAKGFVSPDGSGCVVTKQKTTAYRVSIRSLRSPLPDDSLVRSTGNVNPAGQPIKLIALSQNPQKKTDARAIKAKGLKQVPTADLGNLSDYVLEIGNGAPSATISDSGIKTVGSFFEAVMDGDDYVTLQCGGSYSPRNYQIFNVFTAESMTPVTQVAVAAEDSQIFQSIQVYLADEAEQAIAQKSSITPAPVAAAQKPVAAPAIPVAAQPAKPAQIDSVTVVNGPLQFVVCSPDKVLTVHDDSFSRVLFTSNNGTIVKQAQSWEGTTKTEKVNGQSYKFIKIQVPSQNGTNIGWALADNVAQISQCPYIQSTTTANTGTKTPSAPVATTTPAKPIRTGNSNGNSATTPPAATAAAAASPTNLNDSTCCDFPVNERPVLSYKSGMRRFRANRGGGNRLHAACDLYRPNAEDVVAVADGTVVRGMYYFYQGVYAIEVRHPGGFIVRYGEILGNKKASGINAGSTVKVGQTVGYVGTVNSGCCSPMLHFELYSGKSSGPLTQPSRPGFERRDDLLDPTNYLSNWELKKFGQSY